MNKQKVAKELLMLAKALTNDGNGSKSASDDDIEIEPSRPVDVLHHLGLGLSKIDKVISYCHSNSRLKFETPLLSMLNDVRLEIKDAKRKLERGS